MAVVTSYRDMHSRGYRVRTALRSSVPTRAQAVYSLLRGGTVVYRADIRTSPLLTVTRPYSFIAESSFTGPGMPHRSRWQRFLMWLGRIEERP